MIFRGLPPASTPLRGLFFCAVDSEAAIVAVPADFAATFLTFTAAVFVTFVSFLVAAEFADCEPGVDFFFADAGSFFAI